LIERRKRLNLSATTDAAKVRPAFDGLLLGTLAGFILGELGVGSVLGGLATPGLVLVFAVAGAAIGAFDKTPIVSALAHGQIRTDAIPEKLDAVVVLSSGVLSNGALDVHGIDRILTGIELLNRRIAPRVATTRVRGSFRHGELQTDSDQRRLLALVNSSPRWDIVDSVYSTRDEATRVAALLIPQGARRIGLVTSPMHTRRACAAFEKLGFAVTCIPAREHGSVTDAPDSPPDRLAALREYVYELLGTFKYRAKGWIA
jgi:uncharacterized SAM-binding protein YcdF (DUF218 family)